MGQTEPSGTRELRIAIDGGRHGAAQAAVALARDHGLRCADPVVLADGSNLILWLRPAPVVARVATTTTLLRPDVAAYFGRDLAVAGYLRELGAPVVSPADELPPGPHQRDGRTVSFWRHVEFDSDRAAPTPGLVGRMLTELHAALRHYPGELPLLGTPVVDIERFLADTSRFPQVRPDDAAGMRGAFARVMAALSVERALAQPLHGDAHPGNLLAMDGGWCWTDFEDACAGPVAWDLACLAATRRMDGAAAARHYGASINAAELAPYRELRALHGTVWAVVSAERFPARREAAREWLDQWRGRGERG